MKPVVNIFRRCPAEMLYFRQRETMENLWDGVGGAKLMFSIWALWVRGLIEEGWPCSFVMKFILKKDTCCCSSLTSSPKLYAQLGIHLYSPRGRS